MKLKVELSDPVTLELVTVELTDGLLRDVHKLAQLRQDPNFSLLLSQISQQARLERGTTLAVTWNALWALLA